VSANAVYLRTELQEALQHARHLAECGVPLFVAEPALDPEGIWIPDGGKSHTGYHFPDGWQHSVADPKVVDRWRVGMALCAVMGHVVDGLDVDPRNGGDSSLDRMEKAGLRPRSYGQQRTPSGGTHDLVASLGVRSRDGLLPGVDFKAGTADGGRGFLFLAPTVKVSKESGELGVYTWTVPPNLDELVLVGSDESGLELARFLLERVRPTYDGPAYLGRSYADLTEAERAWADADTAGNVDYWRTLLADASTWDESVRDESGRGWEALSRDCAWAFARLAVTPWTPLSIDDASALYDEVLPPELASDEKCAGKWDDGLVAKAAQLPVQPPPWDGLSVVKTLERIDVSNKAVAAEWLRQEIGQVGTPLAGLFRRGEEVVHTPRIDEDGYVALTAGENDSDGPAQVRTADIGRIASRVQFSYHVGKRLKNGSFPPELFPKDSVSFVLGDVHLLPNLRPLRGVTHTPMLRADGSVLDTVGYDERSRRLFLPEAGLVISPVRDRPTASDVAAARELLLEMLVDFPFNTVHDRANYLALLFTPLMRELLPPPYKMGVINAHQRGSGKSLLAWILRTLHGGVLRGDIPGDGEEFRKQVTAVLDTTTAPIVQFDNVKHLEATQMDALLTTDSWSDRKMGLGVFVTLRNDRLWVCTGNNVTLGGDMVRRVLWVSIDPQVPDPEARTDFHVSDLKSWVRTRRGALLGAMLTLVRAWVVEGCPTGERVGEDDYARWIEACRGVLAVAGLEGVVLHSETVRQKEADDEWGVFLAGLWELFGDEPWTVAQAVARASFEEVPDGMKAGNARSMGKWLSNHEGQWAANRCVRAVGVTNGSKTWKLFEA
jgi:hypothetical protein